MSKVISNITNASIYLSRLREEYSKTTVDDLTFITASKLVDKSYITARQSKLWWWPPLISVSELDSAILLEWWNKKRKYSIYVAENQVTYIAVWGAGMDNEMEEGDINIENDLTEFWEWIAE